MQRALTELERSELINTQRTSGRFVTEDAERIRSLRKEIAQEKLEHFLSEMRRLGVTRPELQEYWKSKEESYV